MSITSPWLPALIAVVLLTIGVWVVYRGWWRRIGDDRTCRSCGFDLHGRDPGGVCPECGADLTHPKRIAIGRRRKRPLPLVLGSALSLLGLVFAIVAVQFPFRQSSWLDLAPTWWLISFELPAASGTSQEPLVDALLARRQAGEVRDDDWMALVERGFALQADPEGDWINAWGDVIVTAWYDGLLTDEQQFTFMRGALSYIIDSPPPIHPGDALIRMTSSTQRTRRPLPGFVHPLDPTMQVEIRLLDTTIDGEPHHVGGHLGTSAHIPRPTDSGSVTMSVARDLERGAYTIETTVEFTLMRANPDLSETTLGRWSEAVTLQVNVLGDEDLPDPTEHFIALRERVEFGDLRVTLNDDGPGAIVRLTAQHDPQRVSVNLFDAKLGPDLIRVRRSGSGGTSDGLQELSFEWHLPVRPDAVQWPVQFGVRDLLYDDIQLRGISEPFVVELPVVVEE